MEKKFNSFEKSDADLMHYFGINPKSNQFDFNFNRYHLDLNYHQLRIIQLSLVYFDSLNHGCISQSSMDDLFYTLRQVDRLFFEDVK